MVLRSRSSKKLRWPDDFEAETPHRAAGAGVVRPRRRPVSLVVKLSMLATVAVTSGIAAPMLLAGDPGQAVLALYRGWKGQEPSNRTAGAAFAPLAQDEITASLPRVPQAPAALTSPPDLTSAAATPMKAAPVQAIPAVAGSTLGPVVEIEAVSLEPDPPAVSAPVRPSPSLTGLALAPVASDGGTPPLAAPAPSPLEPSPGPAALAVSAMAASSATPEPAAMSTPEVTALIARARDLLDHGNINGARLVLERASLGRDGRALMALAETYDPSRLATWGARGVKGDVAKARELYREAGERGIAEARAGVVAFR